MAPCLLKIGAFGGSGPSSSDELLADELSSALRSDKLLSDELLESLDSTRDAARAGAGTVLTPGLSTSVCPCTKSTVFTVS